ncbi:MAG TPA: hemin uptake protein HemP [Methylophilus sp.]
MKIITKMSPKISIPFEDVLVNEGSEVNMKMSHLRSLQSNSLFGDAKAVLISHLGERYMLSLTKQNKLLLTKVKQGLVF